MILGIDKIKLDLTGRYFEIFLGNMDFLNKMIENEMKTLDLELDSIEVGSEFKNDFLKSTSSKIQKEKEILFNKNSIIDNQIGLLVGNLKNDLLNHARNSK